MIYLILILSTLLRLFSLNQSFWLDETAQATISSHPFFQINWAADFQPPLFYLLTHIWQLIGIRAEWFLRLPSVCIGVLTIFVVYKLVCSVFDKKTALLSALLLGISSYHIYFSQEYRMYGLLALFTSLSWYLLWKKKYAWYALCLTAMIFTHYFAFLTIATQLSYVIFFEKKDLRPIGSHILIACVPFLFWIPTLVQQLGTAKQLVTAWPTWSNVSSVDFWKFIPLLLAKFTVGMISPPKFLYGVGVFVVAVVTAYIAALIAKECWQNRRLPANVGSLTFWLAGTVLIAWSTSLFIHANSIHRFVFVLPPFIVLLAYGLLQKSKVKLLHESLLALVIIVFSVFTYLSIFQKNNYREDWKGAIAYTDSHINPTTLVLSEFTGSLAPMDWYTKKSGFYIGASTQQLMTPMSVAQQLDYRIRTHNKIILYTYLYEISDPNRLVEKYLTSHGYALTEEKDFRGVGIVKMFEEK